MWNDELEAPPPAAENEGPSREELLARQGGEREEPITEAEKTRRQNLAADARRRPRVA